MLCVVSHETVGKENHGVCAEGIKYRFLGSLNFQGSQVAFNEPQHTLVTALFI